MSETHSRREFPLVAGQLALDFLNTQVMGEGGEEDLLISFEDLVEWSQAAGIVGPETARVLAAGGRERDRDSTFDLALEARGVVRSAVQCLSRGEPAGEEVVELLNNLLRRRRGQAQLVRGEEGLELVYCPEWSRPEQLLVPVAEAAAELLVSGEPDLVKQCEASDCILYFYDTTKNRRRRWCSMDTCGNRAKAAAHYRRKRAQSAE